MSTAPDREPAPDHREDDVPANADAAKNRSAEPTFTEALSAAASRSGLGQVTPGEAPSARALLAAMGGIRGLVESIVPGLGFLVVYTITQELVPSVLVPLGVAVLFVLSRVIQRQTVVTAIGGTLGIGISAALALLSGETANNFVPGFVINAVTIVVMLGSILARWPLIGLVVGYLTGDPTGWRSDRAKYRVALIATSLWGALAVLRLAVQFPLWYLTVSGASDLTQELGATKLVMGVPLYGILLWVTWLLVRTAYTPKKVSDDATPGV